MGVQDRHYVREARGGYGGLGGNPFPSGMAGMSGWSFNTWLIVINCAVFVLGALLLRAHPMPPPIPHPLAKSVDVLMYYGHFSTYSAVKNYEVWRFLTFQFLHAHLLHLAFNMLALFWFGPLVEHYLGSRRYLAFYLLSGCGGAALYLLLNVGGIIYYGATGSTIPFLLVHNPAVPLVGASAGIFGVLFAAAYIRPNQIITLYLFFVLPISVRIKTLAYCLLGIALFVMYTGGRNAGGEAGHAGGALFGAILIRHANWLNWALWLPLDRLKRTGHHAFRRYDGASSGSAGGGREFFTGQSAAQPGFFERKRRQRQQSELDEVDRILAKIATQGMGSLTDRERGILQRDTERKRGR